MKGVWAVPIIASFALFGILGFMMAQTEWSNSETNFTPLTQPVIFAIADDDDETCSEGFTCVAGDDDAPCPEGFECEAECDDDDGDGTPDCDLKECEIDGVNDGDDTDDGICVKAPNNPPTVTITDPVIGTVKNTVPGETVSFTATASDTEDGDLTGSIVWTSDIDGVLGTGGTIMTTLSEGIHLITATVTDSAGATGNDLAGAGGPCPSQCATDPRTATGI